jgi:hypothetical protein
MYFYFGVLMYFRSGVDMPDGFSDPHFEQRISRSRVPQADLFKDAAVLRDHPLSATPRLTDGPLVPSWCQSRMLNTIISRTQTLNGQPKNADFAGSLASQCLPVWSASLFVISRSPVRLRRVAPKPISPESFKVYYLSTEKPRICFGI